MPDLPSNAGPVLTALARAAIVRRLGGEAVSPQPSSWLDQMGASFVTLMAGGHLRGCIGSLEAYRPLHDDVPANALAAAFHDPRFAPLGSDELDAIRIEVSVLSTPVPMAFASEADALRKLRPGIDGVILEARDRRATFLPQVWADLPDPAIFIRHLKRKAGLWAEYWQDIRLWRYTVTAFREPE